METIQINRRLASKASLDSAIPDADEIVQTGILLQASAGSISAVEFLKARGIDSAVIGRVLAGGTMREEDRSALALHTKNSSASSRPGHAP